MKSVLTKKECYLITHPDLPGFCVENYGDRKMKLIWPSGTCTTEITMTVRGDRHWPINEANILLCADKILEDEIAEKAKKSEKSKEGQKEVDIWGDFDKLFKDFGKLMDRAFKKK